MRNAPRLYRQFLQTFFKRLNKWLLAIASICLLLVIFGDVSSKPILILTNISYSVIAAFVFYLVIDLLPNVRATRELVPYVTRQISLIGGDTFAICQEAARLNGISIGDEWRFDEKDVERFFKGLDTHRESNIVSYDGAKLRFIDFLVYRGKRTEEWLGNLARVSFFLEGEGAARIAEVHESAYLKMLGQMAGASQFQKLEISSIASTLASHQARLTKLRDWAERKGLFVDGAAWNPW